MLSKHLDEAKRDALQELQSLLAADNDISRIALIDDLFGLLRVVLWAPSTRENEIKDRLNSVLKKASGPFWTQEVWMAESASHADKMVYDQAWNDSCAVPATNGRLRISQRRRNRSTWFAKINTPPWEHGAEVTGPPIVTFYSFKGGVGRSTALAAFAIQRARAGERVAVVDLDLDAPGIGILLAADDRGTSAPWGAIDYLLERPFDELDIRDYYHACRREAVTRHGEILVVPAGTLTPEREYLQKLARIDFESPADDVTHPMLHLLNQIKSELQPNWILLDSRAGLSEAAGFLLGGVAHLHVIFGTSSEQSWQGVRMVLERIGASRVRDNSPQLDCLLVQAMVPEDAKVGSLSKAAFLSRALEEFRSHYYAADPIDSREGELWSISDSEASDAPHVPVGINYMPRLAHYDRIDDVADTLADSAEYASMAKRILERFSQTGE